jgi:hypothetical protein
MATGINRLFFDYRFAKENYWICQVAYRREAFVCADSNVLAERDTGDHQFNSAKANGIGRKGCGASST